MPDETPQTTPEPIPPETPIPESVSQPTAPSEPIEHAPIPPTETTPTEVPSVAPETSLSPEGAIPVKDNNSANEPLEPALAPEVPNEPNNQNVTIERNGNDVTITEVMQPTAQMAGNEPFDKTQDKPIDLAEELKTKQREENLKLANQTRQEKKRKKIDAILNLFAKQTNLTNDEVEKLLHVSDATATRYLDELEKEGKIKQVGKTGKHTHYEKV